MDELFSKPTRRHIKDLNLVPIIDMFTTVVFFLLLSTGFMAYTQITVPPSKSSVTTGAAAAIPPLSPKLLIWSTSRGAIRFNLTWRGKDPGETNETLTSTTSEPPRELIVQKSYELLNKLKEAHPDEKTLQLGLGSSIPYQVLISAMDGARMALPDLVLISYGEADHKARSETKAPSL